MRTRLVQNAFFISLLVLTTLAFLGLIQNFLLPLFWAAVLAVLFDPLDAWWQRRLGIRSLASALSLTTIVVIVIFPLFLVGLAVTQEAASVYERIASGDIDVSKAVAYVESMIPVASEYLEQYGINLDDLQERLSNSAVAVSRGLATRALTLGQNAFQVSLDFFLMLYLLFFFLRDGRSILQLLIDAIPLGDAREERLLEKFAAVSRATIKGTLVVGLVQGSLGGTIFWILDIEAALLWGVVMTLLSFLPAVGAAIVWAPASIILIVTGSWVEGAILFAFGTVIIGLADNILRPLLVGRDTEMPDYLILISTLGGLTLFGVSGFVIGPIIAALFLTVWDMFGDELAKASLGDPDASRNTSTDASTDAASTSSDGSSRSSRSDAPDGTSGDGPEGASLKDIITSGPNAPEASGGTSDAE